MAPFSRDHAGDGDRLFGWVDLLVAGVTLSAVTVGVLLASAGLQARLDETERALRQSERANRDLKASVEQIEATRGRNAQIRQMVDSALLDAERRAAARWTPVLADLSRTRPGGVWLTRVTLQGSKVRIEAQGGGPTLADAYTGRLLQSPYFDYVAPAALSGPGAMDRFVLVGRKAGS